MALSKLSYNVDNLDKAREIIFANLHLIHEDIEDQKILEEKLKQTSDVHWGEKITLANKIIDKLNNTNGVN